MRRWRVGKISFVACSSFRERPTPRFEQAIYLLQRSRTELEALVLNEISKAGSSTSLPTHLKQRSRRLIDLLEMPLDQLEEIVGHELQENAALEETILAHEALTLDPHQQGLSGNEQTSETRTQPELRPPDLHEGSAVVSGNPLEWEEYVDLCLRHAKTDTSLEAHLLWQLELSKASFRDTSIAVHIIQNLDENGYLAVSLGEVAKSARAAPEEVAAVHRMIRLFDPVGIASRDLRECLLTQLENLKPPNNLAIRIVTQCLDGLEAGRLDQVAQALGAPLDEVEEAAKLVTSLESKPSRDFQRDTWVLLNSQTSTAAPSDDLYAIEPQACRPDVFIHKIAGEWAIYLNDDDDGIPDLRVKPFLQHFDKIEWADGHTPDGYLSRKIREARRLVRALGLREKLLLRITKSIFERQRDALDCGLPKFGHLSLRDMAVELHLHESTLRRVVTNKYVQTPNGMFRLMTFFRD